MPYRLELMVAARLETDPAVIRAFTEEKAPTHDAFPSPHQAR